MVGVDKDAAGTASQVPPKIGSHGSRGSQLTPESEILKASASSRKSGFALANGWRDQLGVGNDPPESGGAGGG